MHVYFFGLGSNLGDKEENIKNAYHLIEERIGNIVSRSSLYYSEPVDFESDNDFVNSVCKVETEISDPFCVLKITQQIEKQLGRTTKSHNKIHSDRTIDIDILLADDLKIDTPTLTIPHPKINEREFVKIPLNEISS